MSNWINVETRLPEFSKSVLIRVKDFRRPSENVISTSMGYYMANNEWYYECDGSLVNSGHGWFIIEWTEIPE